MKGSPGEAGRDDDPRGGLRAATGGRRLGALSSRSASPPERKGVSLYATRRVYAVYTVDIGGSVGVSCGNSTATQASESGSRNLQDSVDALRLANLSKAAETLRCARSGGPGPSAEAAVTRDRRDRERRAGRSRGGAESAGWREVAEWCHATEGTGHE